MRIVLWSVLAALPLVANAAGPEPKTEEQKILYAIGLAIAENLQPFALTESDIEHVKAGLTDGTLGKPPKAELNVYGPKIAELRQSRQTVVAQRNKAAGKEYAEKVANESGAKKMESGLIYVPVTEGTGPSPTAEQVVKVHYTGKFIDGKEFDSSVKRGEPASFGLSQVIPCWTEGLQQMKVGGKSKLVCPSTLAYGDEGRPGRIPPGATLVFDVELLEIVQQNPAPEQPKAQSKPQPKKQPAKPAQPKQQPSKQ